MGHILGTPIEPVHIEQRRPYYSMAITNQREFAPSVMIEYPPVDVRLLFITPVVSLGSTDSLEWGHPALATSGVPVNAVQRRPEERGL